MKTPFPWENLGPSDSPFQETPTRPAAGASVINQCSLLLNSQRSMLMISLLIVAIVLLNGATKFTETPVQRKKDPKQNIHLSPWSAFPVPPGGRASNTPVSPARTAEPGEVRRGGGYFPSRLRNCSLHLCMTALVLTWFPPHPPRPAFVNSSFPLLEAKQNVLQRMPPLQPQRQKCKRQRSLSSRQRSSRSRPCRGGQRATGPASHAQLDRPWTVWV